MRRFSVKQTVAILAAGRGKEIAVVGDVILDEFVWGSVSRISPEAPVPVVEVARQSFHLGGAANVAHNLRRLGAVPRLVGVLGNDSGGRRVREALAEADISAQGLVEDSARPTTAKTRIIAHSQQVVRADRESRDGISKRIETLALEAIARALHGAAALVLSDYAKGTLTPRLLEGSIALARRKRVPVLVDPKLKHFSAYRGVHVVTPNQLEAAAAAGIEIRSPEDLARAAKKILASLRCQAVLITRGEHGISLFEKGKSPVHIRAAAREVFDVTGAGDTVVATTALGLAAGAKLTEAAVLANYAAGIVVGKLGTAVVEPEELLASVRR